MNTGRDFLNNTVNLVTSPLNSLKDITDTVNSTIATQAGRTWNLMTSAVGGRGESGEGEAEGAGAGAGANPSASDPPPATATENSEETSKSPSAEEETTPPAPSASEQSSSSSAPVESQSNDEGERTAADGADDAVGVSSAAATPNQNQTENDGNDDDTDDLETPRPDTWRPKPVDGSPGEEVVDLSQSSHLNEDYFTSNTKRFSHRSNMSPPPPPLPPRNQQQQQQQQHLTVGAVSPAPLGSGAVTPTFERLQGKPTTALSLSDAHANDGSLGGGSSAGSVTIPQSETGSIRSLVPTNEGGENDVEGMLGSILNEDGSRLPTGEGQEWGLPQGPGADDFWMSDDELDEPDEDDTVSEDERISRWRARKKHFFILSSAGKPVYSRYGDEGVVSQFMGVIQTIISFFQDGDDPVRSFAAGRHKFSILQEGYLYLVAISSTGESDSQLRAQLDALYMQVLSTLTLTTVTKVFSQKENFDLRRLLGGTEVFLDALSDAMTYGDPNTLLGAVECVKMRKSEREKINSTLLKCRTNSLLYGLIIADGRLVSVIRPKRHSLHPPDLQLLFSMLFNASTFRDGGEHWTPICLPKFNSKGFLYAYICFFRKDVAIVLTSAGKDNFFEMKEVKEKVEEQLEKAGSISIIEAAVKRGRYLITDAVPGTIIKHFLYKSRPNVQFTMPTLELQYQTPLARRRLMTLYQRLHGAVHAKNAHLKVHHSIKSTAVSLAWVTPTFELYCIAAANTARTDLAQSANAVVKWVKREEERLFIVGGATF